MRLVILISIYFCLHGTAFAKLKVLEPSIKADLIAAPDYIFMEEIPRLNYLNTFGKIDRFDSDSRKYPGSAVGKLMGPDGVECTASLIANEFILTAAHCFYDKVNGKRKLIKGDFIFYISYHKERYYDSAYVTHITSGFDNGNPDKVYNDWAIGKINRPLGENYGYLGFLDNIEEEVSVGTPLDIIGYGSKFWGGNTQSLVKNCSIKKMELANQSILNDCDTSKGDSGAPVFIQFGGIFYVIAIETAQKKITGNKDGHLEEYNHKAANVSTIINSFYDLLDRVRNSKVELNIKLNNRKNGEHLNYYKIVFTNKCYEKVDVAFKLKNLNSKWETLYWYTFNPNESDTILQNNKTFYTTNRIAYYYAKSKNFSWYGDINNPETRNYKVGDKLYGFKFVRTKFQRWGDFNIVASCKKPI